SPCRPPASASPSNPPPPHPRPPWPGGVRSRQSPSTAGSCYAERGLPLAHPTTSDRWRRPVSVCYCAALVSLPAVTREVLPQHPRERRTPIGPARLARLCLPNSELHVGVALDGDPRVRAALEHGPPPYLLFPGPTAIDVDEARDRLPAAITLVVVDGTWWQAG